MNALEATGALATIFQRDLTPEAVAMYATAISDIPSDLLAESVRELIATSRFFPTVAEIRRTAARIAGLLPPSAGEVLALIRRADVRESVFRRDGSFAYTERYWRWPEDAAPQTVALCELVISKAGEPCDEDGEDLFGWDSGARKVYEAELPSLEAATLANLSSGRMLAGNESRRLPS